MYSARDMKSSSTDPLILPDMQPDSSMKRAGGRKRLIKKRRLMCLGLLALALLSIHALPSTARARGIEVRSTSPEILTVEPGEIVTLSFRVLNDTQAEEELEEKVSLPDGWRLVMPLFEFVLAPGREATRIVVLQAGKHAGAGDYHIGYTATSIRDETFGGDASVRLVLQPVHDLSLTIEGLAPEQVIAGEAFSFPVRLLNLGNTSLAVTMKARISKGGSVSLEPASFTLPPGESRLIQAGGYTDPGIHRLEKQSVRIDAVTDRIEEGRPVSARLTVPMEVVPPVAGGDVYHRYPLEFSTNLGGDDDDHGLQFTLEGDGYLDENRKHRLAFSVRAPDREGKSVLSDREEYQGRYSNESFTVRGGDRSYGLSELTSQGRYGRGLGAQVHRPRSPFQAGAYYVADRWSLQNRNDTGAYFSCSPFAWADMQLNLLRLDYDAWDVYPATTDDLFSFEGNFLFRKKDRLDMEVGYSRGDRYNMEMNRGGRTGQAQDIAYRLNYYGSLFENLRLSVSSRYSGPDFAGRYSDTLRHGMGINFPWTRHLRFNFSFQRYGRNLDADPRRGSAPREDLYRGGAAVMLPKKWRFGLNYSFYDRSDDLPGTGRDLNEHMASVNLGRSSEPFSYRVQARRNWTRNVSIGTDCDYWQYDLSFTYRPGRSLYLSLTGGYSDDERDSEEGYLLKQGRYLGGSARWQPSRDFSIYANYRKNDTDYPDEPLRERAQSDHYGAGLSWRLPNGHKFKMDARRTAGWSGESYNSYSAAYTIPLNVPLKRKKSVGSLTGRVYRADEPKNPGVAGAVVYVDGTAARTDTTGRFQFLTLPPGDYKLRLDERSISLGLVVAGAKSTSVTVTGGKTVEKDIALANSGRLEGRILITDPPGNGANGNGNANGGAYLAGNGNGNGNGKASGGGNNKHDKNGNGNILVELSRDGEIRRTISDKNGGFLFEQLVPGKWALKVYPHNLPEHHYLENGSQKLTVKPGKIQEATIRVLPRMRKIRFIDEGRIRVEAKRP